MRILASAAVIAALLVPTAPALAGTGQCYDAYGRPVGGPFDTFNPNRAFIDSVIARGGRCPVSEAPYGTYRAPGYYYNNPSTDPGGTHSDWCGSNPPSATSASAGRSQRAIIRFGAMKESLMMLS
jgi:hypothetical protein